MYLIFPLVDFGVQMYTISYKEWNSILNIRFYSAIVSMISGAGLGLVGLFLQTLFHNSLASPYTLGVSPIISLSVTIWLWLLPLGISINISWMYLIIIVFSLLVSMGLLILIEKIRMVQSQNIVLIGVLIGMFSGSIQQMIEYQMSADILKQNVIWTAGNFQYVSWPIPISLIVVVGICIIMISQKSSKANLYCLGELYAQNLGLDTRRFVKEIFVLSSIVVAMITVFCGPIGFVGLMSPHISKMWTRVNDHRLLVLPTALIGGGLCCTALWMSHWQIWGSHHSVNVLLSLIGVPFTIFLIIKSK